MRKGPLKTTAIWSGLRCLIARHTGKSWAGPQVGIPLGCSKNEICPDAPPRDKFAKKKGGLGGGEGGRDVWRSCDWQGVDRIDEKSENGRGESQGQGKREVMSREKKETCPKAMKGKRKEKGKRIAKRRRGV